MVLSQSVVIVGSANLTDGGLPVVRLSARVPRVKPADFEAYIEDHRKEHLRVERSGRRPGEVRDHVVDPGGVRVA